jgi:beta-lactamase superfamily II metal-dependent hydrolase
MLFTLEALNARHGDALLLYYGPRDSPRLVLVDGGPAGVYGRRLRPRLRGLLEARGDDPLAVELVLVSHIDDDHIHGILDLTGELAERFEERAALPFTIRRLWHNSFDDIIGNQGAELFTALDATIRRGGAVPNGLRVEGPSQAVAASVEQGRRLRNHATRLGIPVNRPFRGLVARDQTGPQSAELPDGLTLTVLAPSLGRAEALQREWDTVVRRRNLGRDQALAEAAAYLDNKVYNLSSMVVLATLGSRTMLLTGDARGDDILEGLEAGRLLDDRTVHVNLLKLPHHGSDRNVEEAFFRTVTADHYVVSADGKYGNPDLETLRMLSAARPDDDFTLHLTNREPRLAAFFDQERAAGRTYTVSFRDRNSQSVHVDLEEALPG